MPDVERTNDLGPLSEAYEIVGELRRGDNARSYAAKRRADGEDVEITVVQAPNDDANHSLAHFASDATLLTNGTHPHVVRVRDGKWLAADSFAIVRDRGDGATLGEMLARSESLSNPRIADILQDVLGALDWARAKGIVHRAVNPGSLWFERGTDRALVSFRFTPVSIHGVADACDDARTVGNLAWAMLSGKVRGAEDERLASLRPTLAKRVLDETEAMVACKSGDMAPNVSAFIATIAMADALREGELETAMMQAELIETHRVIREQWEAERDEVVRKAVEEAERCAKEQAAIQKTMSEDRARIDADRLVVDQRRAEVEQELVALADARALVEQRIVDLETERAAVDELRTDVEQRLVEERQTMEELLAAGRAANASASVARMRADVAVPLMVVPEPLPAGRRWVLPAAIGGAVLLFGALLALAHHERASLSMASNVVVPESILTRHLPVGPVPTQDPNFLTRSEAGSIVRPVSARPIPPAITPKRSAPPDSARRDTVTKRDTTTHTDTLSLSP